MQINFQYFLFENFLSFCAVYLSKLIVKARKNTKKSAKKPVIFRHSPIFSTLFKTVHLIELPSLFFYHSGSIWIFISQSCPGACLKVAFLHSARPTLRKIRLKLSFVFPEKLIINPHIFQFRPSFHIHRIFVQIVNFSAPHRQQERRMR